jgi:hypothetical protein
MSEDQDRVDVGAWQVPPPPDGIVDRVMTTLGEDTRVAHLPAQPVDVGSGARRGLAVVVAAVLGAAAAAAAVVVVYESRTDEPRDRAALGPTRPAPVSPPSSKKSATPPAKARDLPTSPRKLPSQAAREQLLEDIVRARIERERVAASMAAGGGAPAPPGAITGNADMDPDQIRTSVREVLPMLTECYDQAPEPMKQAGGTIVAELTVTGEPDVGTLIQDVSLIEGDKVLLDEADFGECVKQTLLSVELPPLDAGGKVTIHYPFAFSMGDEEDTEDEEPEMEPPSKTKPKTPLPIDTIEQLIDKANAASRTREYSKALTFAKRALTLEPDNQQALTVGAVAACNLKQAAVAKAYLAKLSGGRAGMIKQICLRNSVALD